jgi:hypothetical protein
MSLLVLVDDGKEDRHMPRDRRLVILEVVYARRALSDGSQQRSGEERGECDE